MTKFRNFLKKLDRFRLWIESINLILSDTRENNIFTAATIILKPVPTWAGKKVNWIRWTIHIVHQDRYFSLFRCPFIRCPFIYGRKSAIRISKSVASWFWINWAPITITYTIITNLSPGCTIKTRFNNKTDLKIDWDTPPDPHLPSCFTIKIP